MFYLIDSLLSTLGEPPAYLDPGAGNLLLQLLIVGLLSLSVILRASWSKIRRLFGKSEPEEQDDEDDQDNA